MEADANTKFFHRYASHRKKKNTIARLMNDNGDWVEGEPMNNVILEYFNRIFCSENPGSGESFFEGIVPRVTQVQNELLLRPFEFDEVKSALFAMFPDKAPGPDGINPGFYQHFWDVVGGMLIMAKMITNRMKPLMEGVISELQSAFIPDRLITDNILVAVEVGHFLNRKQCGMLWWSALKLDMAKAYDRMEWPFLEKMMLALSFDVGWVQLIMKCVSTISYNLLVNGSRSDPILPTRGLRQGGPLSPYLFIICAEGLSLLLQKAHNRGLIHGCRVARGAPPISHLFFADDSLLFFKANVQEASEVKRCLSVYEDLSGQVVNYHKSSICYSRNTSNASKEVVEQVLGVGQAPNFGKYLGLPSFVRRNKKAAFAYIEDKIRQRIGSRNKRLLSQAAIERTMNHYWWDSGTDRRIHWKAWDKLCVPKKYGRLGFKELRAFNLAMLGKQAWRMLTKPESLVARIYKARYYAKGSFFDAQVGNNPSLCWRSIMAAKSIICSGVRRRIGNGESTLIWTHPWLQDDQDPMIQTEMPIQLQDAKVVGLIDQQTRTWDLSILTDLFHPSDVANILKIPVSPDYDDTWYWPGDQRGVYSVKGGYRLIVDFDGMLYAASILYNIWRARNGAVWNALLPQPQSLLAAVKSALHAWKRANPPAVQSHAPLPTTQSHHLGSHAPLGPHGTVQEEPPRRLCRIDARFIQNMGKATVGEILLDMNGGYVAAFSAPLPVYFSPLIAEALACKEALSWLKDRGEQNIEIYTDCLMLQRYLTTPSTTFCTYVGYAIDACRAATVYFQSFSFHFIPRLDNFIAHALATSAYQQSAAMYWDILPPDIISTYF
ncbi:PREDICTED: uncharacterized protein LOC109150749 [Ipomoea nil]|uniref:uncharacterized protein LOC109150749 n=1 Tax=Ipomoea nil TaxID=35883 RepID=UPI0009019252|nr:PREDICTED: uncharacterized protein LOC109150749 [Ipomoea nil]